MTEERKTTSIKIIPQIWEDFKIDCIKRKLEMSERLETMIKRELEVNDIQD